MWSVQWWGTLVFCRLANRSIWQRYLEATALCLPLSSYLYLYLFLCKYNTNTDTNTKHWVKIPHFQHHDISEHCSTILCPSAGWLCEVRAAAIADMTVFTFCGIIYLFLFLAFLHRCSAVHCTCWALMKSLTHDKMSNMVMHSKHIYFLDAIASPCTYPCQSVGESVSEWLIVSDLEIAIASPNFASLLMLQHL